MLIQDDIRLDFSQSNSFNEKHMGDQSLKGTILTRSGVALFGFTVNPSDQKCSLTPYAQFAYKWDILFPEARMLAMTLDRGKKMTPKIGIEISKTAAQGCPGS
jgi:hypothetical protein